MNYYVYILYSVRFNKYYIGQTQDIIQRFAEHNAQKVPSTAPFVPWQRVGVIEKNTRSEAMELEKKLKNLNRLRLESFIEKYMK
jgi:putative endonuclease